VTIFGAVSLGARRGPVGYAEQLAGQFNVVGPIGIGEQTVVTDSMEPDPAGAADARIAAAGVLFDPLGAAIGRAD
jgi:hypothetical protein